MRISFTLPLLAVLALSACGIEKNDCNDGVDNDGDGLLDQDDAGCLYNDNQAEYPDPTPLACGNGVDDDGDGFIDYPNDPGCEALGDDDEVDPPGPPAECNDGLDNNGNGIMDYPFDPGCTAIDDATEDDPPPVTECFDGIDNDGDGYIDYPEEPGCGSAGDDAEYNPIVGECGPSIDMQPYPATGAAEGERASPAPNELEGACGGLGAELVWTYEVTTTSALVVQTNHPETTLDTVLYVRTTCRNPDTELACDDDDEDSRAGTLVVPRAEPGVYYIVVDSYGPGSLGHVKLTVEQRTAEHDACDPEADDPCAPGLICRSLTEGAPTTCEFHECGDGIDNDGDGAIDYPNETGCATRDDDTELLPPGAPIPDCGNGTDDDADTLTDYPMDPGCDAASDLVELDECVDGLEVRPLPPGDVRGTTAGGAPHLTADCDTDTVDAPEAVHAYKVPVTLEKLRFELDPSFPAVFSVRRGICDGGPEVGCVGNTSGAATRGVITIDDPPVGTTYFAVIDGDFAAAGNYVIRAIGELPGGAACTAGDLQLVCTDGFTCGGGGTCVPTACNDDADNDGDGDLDYPNDPGCSSISDTAEIDPVPAPDCGNGIDDDGDGHIDFAGADPGCSSASDGNELDACFGTIEVLDLPESGVTGETSGESEIGGVICDGVDGGFAPEKVHAFRVDKPYASLTFSTIGSSFDTVLYVRRGECDGGDVVACEGAGGALGDSVTLISPPNDDYFVFVDGNWSMMGDYVLNVSGVLGPGAPCDPASTAFHCTGGWLCRDGGPGVCEPTRCNDGTDSDGDTRVDEFDAGCDSILDDDETDPDPLPACANGVDDDGDGAIDFPVDPGCGRAADANELDCVDMDPIVDVTATGTYNGTTVGMHNDFTPSCLVTSAARDVVHKFTTLGALEELRVDTDGSALDTALVVKRGGCDTVDYACNDDSAPGVSGGRDSLLILPNAGPGSYFFVVDGWGSASGTYTLHVRGRIKAGERCDPAQSAFMTCVSGTCRDTGTGNRCQ